LSDDNGQVTFDGERGGFDQRLFVGAVFGQVALSKAIYLNAAGGGGTIDVTDITRSFTLGAALESYTAETEGSYRFLRIGGGAFVPLSDQVLLNPFGQYTYENVSIDGFTETNGAASLSYGDSEYQSDRITLGLSAIISPTDMPDWKFNLRGSIEHDLNNDPLLVSLGPNADSLGEVSAPRPDRTFGYLSGSAVRELGAQSFVSFSGSAALGQSGTTGYVASLTYKRSF
jgi:outer membrane lipase/esterase